MDNINEVLKLKIYNSLEIITMNNKDGRTRRVYKFSYDEEISKKKNTD